MTMAFIRVKTKLGKYTLTSVKSNLHEWLVPFLLSLYAHNHVDDYSSTLGDVRKTKQKHCLKFLLKKKKKKKVDWSVGCV